MLFLNPLSAPFAAPPETEPAPADAPPLPAVNYPMRDSNPVRSDNVPAPVTGESVWIVEDGVQVEYIYGAGGWIFLDLNRRAHFASVAALREIAARRREVALTGGTGNANSTSVPYVTAHGSTVVHHATVLPNAPARFIVPASPGHQTGAVSAHLPR